MPNVAATVSWTSEVIFFPPGGLAWAARFSGRTPTTKPYRRYFPPARDESARMSCERRCCGWACSGTRDRRWSSWPPALYVELRPDRAVHELFPEAFGVPHGERGVGLEHVPGALLDLGLELARAPGDQPGDETRSIRLGRGNPVDRILVDCCIEPGKDLDRHAAGRVGALHQCEDRLRRERTARVHRVDDLLGMVVPGEELAQAHFGRPIDDEPDVRVVSERPDHEDRRAVHLVAQLRLRDQDERPGEIGRVRHRGPGQHRGKK